MKTAPVTPPFDSTPLLETRLYVPPLSGTHVLRPRLQDLLKRGLQAPLILVSAPPGYGKSSLLSEWIRSQADLDVTWLSLESSDQEWGLFFRYLVTAWQHIFPQAGEEALSILGTSPSTDREALLNLLINDLLAGRKAIEPKAALLVLDDYHRIESEAIHASLAYLVEHLPPDCHIALLTRSDPPLPVFRWRAGGRILEVRADDLRFTSREAAQFLGRALQLNLPEEQIEVLESRTEGWIVGLKMAALSLQTCKDTSEFVRDFDGSQRFVLDYLVEEVIRSQPEEVQEFLLATSPLEKFCAALCDATLGVDPPRSQRSLEYLERANLFLIPLDDHRWWFRYHHLFADLLRVRLEQSNPERIPDLKRRAARWCAQNGQWREAIQYALQAGDFELGATFIEQAIRTSGHAATVRKGGPQFLMSGMQSLIEPFPPGLVNSRPLLALARAMAMIEKSQLKDIEPLLRFAERGILDTDPFPEKNEVLGAIYRAQGWAAVLLGDDPWIIDASNRVIRYTPEDIVSTADALLQIGTAYYYRGELNQMDSSYQQALELDQKQGHTYNILNVLETLGRMCCHKGELERAERLFKHALEISSGQEDRYPRLFGDTQRDYSDLLREQNHLEEARTMMSSSLKLLEKSEFVSGRGLGYLHMARILLASDDPPGAKAMLQKVEALRHTHTIYPDLEALVQVFRAQLSLADGELEAAGRIIESCLESPCCRHELHREWALVTKACILVRLGHSEEAFSVLGDRLEAAKANGRGRNWLDMVLVSAEAHYACGSPAKAFQLLKEALEFGRAQGFRRIFLERGEPMRDLLEEFRVQFPRSQEARLAVELLSSFPPPPAPGPGVPIPEQELFEPLSSREQEVLRLMCQGLSNKEIASRLVLSVGTVKTHIHKIFGKLGVRDRPQAIAKASHLNRAEFEPEDR